MFLIFATQIHSFICNYNALFCIYGQEGSIVTVIILTPNTPPSSLSVGSKIHLLLKHLSYTGKTPHESDAKLPYKQMAFILHVGINKMEH